MQTEAFKRVSDVRKLAPRIHRWQIVILLLLMALPILGTPAAQAQGGCELVFRIGGTIPNYTPFPSSNIITSSYIIYSDSNCQTEYVLVPGVPSRISLTGAMVLASSRASAEDLCEKARKAPVVSISVIPHNSRVYRCHYGRSRGGRDGDGGSFEPACNADVSLPLTDLRLHANDGMNSGIQFLNNCGLDRSCALRNGLPRCGRCLVEQRLLGLFPAGGASFSWMPPVLTARVLRTGKPARPWAGFSQAASRRHDRRPCRRGGPAPTTRSLTPSSAASNLRLRAAPWGQILGSQRH